MQGPGQSEPVNTTDRFLRPLLLFVVTGLMTAVILGLLMPRGHLVYVWPITGVQLALLLNSTQSRGRLRLEVASASTAFFIASVLLHTPWQIALLLALVQALELSALLTILAGHVQCFDDLKTRARVSRLLLAAAVVPVLAALASPLARLTHLSELRVWTGVALSDSLGIAVFTPAVLFLLSGKLLRSDQVFDNFKAGLTVSLVFVGVTGAIFTQHSTSFLFMIFPPLVLVVFVLGVRGAIFTSLAATLIACWATATGHGPMWMSAGALMHHRVLLLQIFLWTTAATSLPVGSLLDEQRASEHTARKNQAIYETLLENSDDMVILSRLDGSSRFVSPAVEKVTGWTPIEFLAAPSFHSIHADDRDLGRAIIASLREGHASHDFRYRILHKNGGFRWVEALVRGYSDFDDGAIKGYVATVRDISRLKQIEDSNLAEKQELASQNELLAELAGRDELTSLANRRTFNHVLALEAKRQSRSSDSLSLLMIDVDSFKKFNDRYGHHAGDLCLKRVASAFVECAARASDLAARFGGEEFAVLLPQTDEFGAMRVAEAMLESIRKLHMVHIDSPSGFVSVSVGISTWPPFRSADVTTLIQQADRALYESKRSGRSRVTVWDSSRHSAEDPDTGFHDALDNQTQTI